MDTGLFGSNIIDVLIGLFLVYIVLSMMASAINEYISNLLDKRAKNLEAFIKNLFAEARSAKTGSQQIQDFYSSIFINTQIGTKQLPAYINREDFAQALFDVAHLTVNAGDNLKTLRTQAVAALPADSPVLKVLLNAIDRTDGTRQSVDAYIEKWFDGQMDHLRNQYKKWTNYILLAIGLIVAFALNVDTIRVTDALLANPALRQAIVEQAKVTQDQQTTDPQTGQITVAPKSFTELRSEIDALSLPIGWPEPGAPMISDPGFFWWAVKKLMGILVTGFAVSQGAPFWFDLLNKITNLRAATRPPDEQAKHAPQPPRSTDAAATDAAQTAATAAAAAAAQVTPEAATDKKT